jgi:hypothetical protein
MNRNYDVVLQYGHGQIDVTNVVAKSADEAGTVAVERVTAALEVIEVVEVGEDW